MHPPIAPVPRSPRATPALVLALVLLVAFSAGGLAILNAVPMAPGTAIPEQALESAGERSAEALTAGLPVITTRATPWGCLEHEGGCGATMTGDSRQEVLDKWNRRVGGKKAA